MLGAVLAKRQALKAVEAINAKDISALEAAAGNDLTFRFPGRTAMSGRFEGKQAVLDWFRGWFDRLERVRFTPIHVCVERIFTLGASNTVTVEWEAEITPAGHPTFRATGVTAFEARRGKVVRVVDYVFDQDLLEAAYPLTDESPSGPGD
jgi:ketosteroid isomerase-like protein